MHEQCSIPLLLIALAAAHLDGEPREVGLIELNVENKEGTKPAR
jgi:hypothetical protein